MEEDTLLVCRKTGKTGEDSNPANSNEHLLLMRVGVCTKKHNHIEKNTVLDKDISSWQLKGESVGLT